MSAALSEAQSQIHPALDSELDSVAHTLCSVILRDAVHIGACPFLTFFLKNLQRFSYDLGRSDVGGVHVTVRVGST